MLFITTKRIIAIFCIFVLLLAGLDFRLIGITTKKPYTNVASQGKTSTITVSESRGSIYDRNHEKLVNNSSRYFAVLKPSVNAVSVLSGKISEEKFYDVFSRLSEARPILVELDYPLVDTDGMKVMEVFDRYSENQSACHLIGYLDDTKKQGVSGIEKSCDDLLNANAGKLSASFTINGLGKVLDGEMININNQSYNSPAGISLTLDKKIQEAVEKALSGSDIIKGAAVVLDAKTSAVLACASAPTFDPDNLGESLNDENSPFINRALTAYSVGSVYKPIVAAAAIENNIEIDEKYNCTGSIKIGDVTFNCHKRDGHGIIDMETAIALSCNCYFIDLASRIGKEDIVRLSKDMGLGESISLADYLESDSGVMPDNQDIKNPGDLANLSFGQGTLLATPLQIAAVYACFANGGVYNTPYLLNEMIDENGEVYASYIPEEGQRVISKHIAQLVSRMLTTTVEDGSGKNAKPEGSTAAGKTSTAQSGWYNEGKEVVQTWFAGFFPAEDPEYVIVVMMEDGSSPTTDCAPVFREIAEKILKMENHE